MKLECKWERLKFHSQAVDIINVLIRLQGYLEYVIY